MYKQWNQIAKFVILWTVKYYANQNFNVNSLSTFSGSYELWNYWVGRCIQKSSILVESNWDKKTA